MNTIRVYTPDETGYQNLKRAAAILTALSRSGITYIIGETYFDYGQDWAWTTIIAHDPAASFGSYQALCPRDHEIIVTADDLLAAINQITENRRNDSWSQKKDW